MNQMTQAASLCPEVYLGFDERVLVFLPAAVFYSNVWDFQDLIGVIFVS